MIFFLKVSPGTLKLMYVQLDKKFCMHFYFRGDMIMIKCSTYTCTIMLCLFVLYRFGGAEFPPIIMFKIFIHSGGQGVKYYCGKKVIKPASEVIKMLSLIHVLLPA